MIIPIKAQSDLIQFFIDNFREELQNDDIIGLVKNLAEETADNFMAHKSPLRQLRSDTYKHFAQWFSTSCPRISVAVHDATFIGEILLGEFEELLIISLLELYHIGVIDRKMLFALGKVIDNNYTILIENKDFCSKYMPQILNNYQIE